MATNQKQAQYEIITIANDFELTHPELLALRFTGATNKTQQAMLEELENRELATLGQTALGRQVQAQVGQLARTAGAELHRTVMHHVALLDASRGTSLHECEEAFLRRNLEQEAQAHLALKEAVTKNLHEQVSRPLSVPSQKRRWFG